MNTNKAIKASAGAITISAAAIYTVIAAAPVVLKPVDKQAHCNDGKDFVIKKTADGGIEIVAREVA